MIVLSLKKITSNQFMCCFFEKREEMAPWEVEPVVNLFRQCLRRSRSSPSASPTSPLDSLFPFLEALILRHAGVLFPADDFRTPSAIFKFGADFAWQGCSVAAFDCSREDVLFLVSESLWSRRFRRVSPGLEPSTAEFLHSFFALFRWQGLRWRSDPLYSDLYRRRYPTVFHFDFPTRPQNCPLQDSRTAIVT